ncbi:hypothetical protein [Bradyrhizobium sp. NAS96.2]|uniref:hypothetical protein n=1 Tax=Bradyrhizobium sp. NAS96.2 TaxID=1680160 RepID=UPI001161191A|nr:hypothetical protein [Bradyrhizobium sp. NAS96.2]
MKRGISLALLISTMLWHAVAASAQQAPQKYGACHYRSDLFSQGCIVTTKRSCSATYGYSVTSWDKGASCTRIPPFKKAKAKLICTQSLFGASCETPHLEFGVGTYDSFRLKIGYAVPDSSWRLTGPASATYSGREVFDVEVKGQGIGTIDCQWHTEGSKQLFGPGGYVVGYCSAPARKGGPV